MAVKECKSGATLVEAGVTDSRRTDLWATWHLGGARSGYLFPGAMRLQVRAACEGRRASARKGMIRRALRGNRFRVGRHRRDAVRAFGAPPTPAPTRTRQHLSLQGGQALPISSAGRPARTAELCGIVVGGAVPDDCSSRVRSGAGGWGDVQLWCELWICIRKRASPRQARKVGRTCGNESVVVSLNCEKAVQGPTRSMDAPKDTAAGKPFHAFAQRCMDAAPSLITQVGSRVNGRAPQPC